MGPVKRTISVKVLLIEEGNQWAIQCLDYDIGAQGKTKEEAENAFERTFLSQIELDVKDNKEPFEGISKAPQRYWDLFRRAQQPKDPRRFCVPEWVLPGYIIDAHTEDLRVIHA